MRTRRFLALLLTLALLMGAACAESGLRPRRDGGPVTEMTPPTGEPLSQQRWTGAFTVDRNGRAQTWQLDISYGEYEDGMLLQASATPEVRGRACGHDASHTRSGHRHKHQWRRRTRPKRLAAGVGRVQRGCFRGIHALCHRRWDDGSGQRRQCAPFAAILPAPVHLVPPGLSRTGSAL